MKSLGYVVFDSTWNRLVRWVDADPALWCADPESTHRGPTIFPTKKAARKAIAATKKFKEYAWASNNYDIYEVHE